MCAELMKREMTKPCFQFLEGCFKGGVIKILIDKLVHMQYKNNYVQRWLKELSLHYRFGREEDDAREQKKWTKCK